MVIGNIFSKTTKEKSFNLLGEIVYWKMIRICSTYMNTIVEFVNRRQEQAHIVKNIFVYCPKSFDTNDLLCHTHITAAPATATT